MKKTYALLLLLIISISAKAQESFSFSLDEAIQYALQNNYTVRNAGPLITKAGSNRRSLLFQRK